MNATTTIERAPLTKIVGTVEDITSAPDRSKPGKILLTSGKVLRAFADKLQMVERGGTYDFGCELNDVGGVVYNNVKAVRAAVPDAQPRQQQRAQAQVQREPTRQSAPIDPPQHEPRPNNGGNNGYYRPTSPADKKSMFRCACVTAFIRAGQLRADRNEIAAFIAEIDAGYDMGVGETGDQP